MQLGSDGPVHRDTALCLRAGNRSSEPDFGECGLPRFPERDRRHEQQHWAFDFVRPPPLPSPPEAPGPASRHNQVFKTSTWILSPLPERQAKFPDLRLGCALPGAGGVAGAVQHGDYPDPGSWLGAGTLFSDQDSGLPGRMSAEFQSDFRPGTTTEQYGSKHLKILLSCF